MRPDVGGVMDRDEMLAKLKSEEMWDLIIIGGGATGLGTAVDAAARGFKTLLLEQSDFAKATSSRSTKLIHGGLRYLQQGNISLVVEALHERGLLAKNAPHLFYALPFLLPNYKWWEGPFYGAGLKIYDLLAGKLGIESSVSLSREETLNEAPNLNPKALRGSTIFYDGQFDDARLAITLAQTAADKGAVLLNYMPVTSLIKEHGVVMGVTAKDSEEGSSYSLYGKIVINATGVFSDDIRRMDKPKAPPIIASSRGTHIVLPKSFHPSDKAILIPHTEDKRIIFIIPWHDRILIGTTDVPTSSIELEPKATRREINFLLKHAAKYLVKPPRKKDILSIFAGLRPLVKSSSEKKTAKISRDHLILVDPSGLITIAGGKWTTYRKMAEDVIDMAIKIGNLKEVECKTKALHLHGYKKCDPLGQLSPYGTDVQIIKNLIKAKKENGELLHPNLPYCKAEIYFAIRYEMARSVEDLLARRTRALLLDAKAALEIAPAVAHILAKELKKSKSWEEKTLSEFKKIAKNYTPRGILA
jgi:glycerol-3-phosphate dehydrogenase